MSGNGEHQEVLMDALDQEEEDGWETASESELLMHNQTSGSTAELHQLGDTSDSSDEKDMDAKYADEEESEDDSGLPALTAPKPVFSIKGKRREQRDRAKAKLARKKLERKQKEAEEFEAAERERQEREAELTRQRLAAGLSRGVGDDFDPYAPILDLGELANVGELPSDEEVSEEEYSGPEEPVAVAEGKAVEATTEEEDHLIPKIPPEEDEERKKRILKYNKRKKKISAAKLEKQMQAKKKYETRRKMRERIRKQMEAIEELKKKRGSQTYEGGDEPAWLAKTKGDDLFTWDYCMVFQIGDAKKTVKSKKLGWEMTEERRFEVTTAKTIKLLQDAGLRTSVYKSVQKDEVYCLIGASESRIEQEADRVDYDTELDTKEVVTLGEKIGMPLCKNVHDRDTDPKDEMNINNWMPLYGKFDSFPRSDKRRSLYKQHRSEGPLHWSTNFRSKDRLRLTNSIIEADQSVGGASFSTYQATKSDEHSLIAYFPLHQQDKRKKLVNQWFDLKNVFWQPLWDIRNYYGEKIAIYFAFLGFYCRWLIGPAVVGLGFWIAQLVTGKVDVDPIIFFGIFIAFWGTFFLEFWKRQESVHRTEWGMHNFAAKEQTRPEFVGEVKRSPIDGSLARQFPMSVRVLREMVSQGAIWTMIVIVVVSVVGLIVFRSTQSSFDGTLGGIILAVINAVQIQLLNFVYGKMALRLTIWENHRTDSQYENALISKTFLFKFVNSYNSLFYIAFFKQYDPNVDGCIDGNCMGELQVQLTTIFFSLIVISNFMEIGVPKIKSLIAARKNKAEEETEDGQVVEVLKSQAELEFELETYESTFDDFDEMVIQFGFVTLFVVAFPLAPALALLNNYIEIRLDASKICMLSRRPPPDGAPDIGTWYDILEIMGYFSVITNSLLIVFNTDIIDRWTDGDQTAKVWVFVALEHFILLLKFAIAYFVPDETAEVSVHLDRQRFLVDVLILGNEEEHQRVKQRELLAEIDEAQQAEEEKIEVSGLPEEEFWKSVDKAFPEPVHMWTENTYDKLEGRAKWAPDFDEDIEFEGCQDDRMRLHLVNEMQLKCREGDFTLQPSEFWMIYDIYYLGTIFATQRMFLKYCGNAVMTEQQILFKLEEEGGVHKVAFEDEEFVNYLRWWIARRTPRWSVYLKVKSRKMTKDYLQAILTNVEPALKWTFTLMLSRDGIIVQPIAK